MSRARAGSPSFDIAANAPWVTVPLLGAAVAVRLVIVDAYVFELW